MCGVKFGPPFGPPQFSRSNETRCAPMRRPLATPDDPDSLSLPRGIVVTGASRCSLPREHRDEDTIKASAQGVRSVFTAARRTIGKGRAIPQAGTPWP